MTTETKAKHTPGPWRVSKCVQHRADCPQTCNEPSHTDLLIEHGDSDTFSPLLAQVYSDGGRLPKAANARLIAAAPELLEALKAVMQHASLDPDHLHKFGQAYQQAESALAKAEGHRCRRF